MEEFKINNKKRLPESEEDDGVISRKRTKRVEMNEPLSEIDVIEPSKKKKRRRLKKLDE